MSILTSTQDYNPLTWDIQLNPAAWWLSMSDINRAATVELKSSLYAGNMNLTADQYQEVLGIISDKFSGIDVTGMIAPWGITKNRSPIASIEMIGRDAWLYMSPERLWYWDATDWAVYIWNSGDFYFKGDANNYIQWDWTDLTIRGAINLTSWWDPVTWGDVTLEALEWGLSLTGGGLTITSGWASIKWWKTSYSSTTAWFWLWDDTWTYKFSIGNATKSLKWDWTDLTVTGIVNATGGAIGWFDIGSDYLRDTNNSFGFASTVTWGDDVRFWAWSLFADRASAPFRITESWVLVATSWTIGGSTLSWSAITWGTFQTASSWARVIISWSTLQSFYSTESYPRFQVWWLWVRFANWTDIADMQSGSYTWWLLDVTFWGRFKPDEIVSTWNITGSYLYATSWYLFLNWQDLYSDGTDLFWNGVKIN